jgi:predicted glycosyltransferase
MGLRARVRLDEGLALQVAWQLDGGGQRRQTPVLELAAPPPPLTVSPSRRVRSVLLYSHYTYGLGHLRRNTAIAHFLLKGDPELKVVLVTGSPFVGSVPMPAGVSIVRLPRIRRASAAVNVGAETYQPLEPGQTMPRLWAERAGLLASTLLRVRPDVFLVDHAPLGTKGELALALSMARETLPSTRVVIGLRDVLDDPEAVRQVWREQGIHEALETFYDRILVYGSQELFDSCSAYGFSAAVVREQYEFARRKLARLADLLPGIYRAAFRIDAADRTSRVNEFSL